MTPEIWNDIRIRMQNLRGDILGQIGGDINNMAMHQTLQMLNAAQIQWEESNPAPIEPLVPGGLEGESGPPLR